MIAAWRRVDAWLLAPAPATRLAALRLLTGVYAVAYLVIRTPGLLKVADLPPERFHPVGPLFWMPGPLAPGVARVALAATVALGVAFVAGWRWRVTGPAFALAFLAVTTYRLSWGHVLHTDNLPALHLLVVGFVPAADAWSLDARRGRLPAIGTAAGASGGHARYGWPVRVMALLTVVSYVLAGVAKVRPGGLDWLVGDVLRNQVAYDNLRKVLLGDPHSPVGGWLSQYSWVFPPLAMATVALELGAPIALLGGRVRTVWVIAAWSFHAGIVALMAIGFPYELTGVAYAPFFRTERLVSRAAAELRRRDRRLAARRDVARSSASSSSGLASWASGASSSVVRAGDS